MKRTSISLLTAALLAAAPIVAAQPADAEAIIAEAEAADAAAMAAQDSGDLATFADYLAEDYAYIDLSGNRIGKADILARRREDKHAWIEISDSEFEAILLAPTAVLLRGRTDGVSSYCGGLPRPASSRYSVVWRKDADGKWRMVAAQTTDRIKREYPVKTRIVPPAGALDRFAGAYTLAAPKTALPFVLTAAGDHLVASIPGQLEAMAFYPDGEASFFATDRPFELRFSEDGGALTLTTWGVETNGAREQR